MDSGRSLQQQEKTLLLAELLLSSCFVFSP
jgi:hypothetical protein